MVVTIAATHPIQVKYFVRLFALVVFTVIAIMVWNVRHASLGQSLTGATSCVVGEPGTAAKMEIAGQTAEASCQLEVSKDGFYSYQGPVNETVVCQYQWHGDSWTVYDHGLMNLVGSDLCSHLQKKVGQ